MSAGTITPLREVEPVAEPEPAPAGCVVVTGCGQFQLQDQDGDTFLEHVGQMLDEHGEHATVTIPGHEAKPQAVVFCRHVYGWRPIGY